MTDAPKRWWRHTWLEAVYASDLKPMPRFIAMIYAEHARDQRIAWASLDTLVTKTGLGRTQAKKWRGDLINGGWLVEIQKATHHRATHYVLSIPEDARGSGGRPSDTETGGREADPLMGARGSDFEVRGSDSASQGVGEPTPINPLDKSIHQSSSSPARTHLASLLGWGEEDERLDLTNDFLQANNVKAAKPWLNRCHENGDLERLYLAFIDEQTSDPWASTGPTEETWMQKKGPDVYTLREVVLQQFEDHQSALDFITYQTDAIHGQGNFTGDPEYDYRSLLSAWYSIEHARKWDTTHLTPGMLPEPRQKESA